MKTKVFVSALFLLIATLAAYSPSIAQDTEPPCSVAEVLSGEHRGMIEGEWLQSVITTLNANIEDDDGTNFLGTARELREILARVEADCRGLHFTSEEEGMKAAIGPVTFPDGVWRVSMAADGMLSVVKLTDLAGTCYDFISTILSANGNTIENPAEVIVKLQGCEAIIEVEVIGGETWDLMFEAVKLDE